MVLADRDWFRPSYTVTNFVANDNECFEIFIFAVAPPWIATALRWRHNGHESVSNHQPYHCLLNLLFGCTSKKTWKLRVTGLCVGNSPGTGEFAAQMASNAENVSIWWRHHGIDAIRSESLLIRYSVESLWKGQECLTKFCKIRPIFMHHYLQIIVYFTPHNRPPLLKCHHFVGSL